MSAKPIIPGQLYRVRGCGLDITVIAVHGCAAICNVLAQAITCAD